MKIEKQGTVQFKDVKAGQVFGYRHYMCMRTRTILTSREIANAVDLDSGTYLLLNDTEEAILYENAKVVIE